jgi:hypothetical protein
MLIAPARRKLAQVWLRDRRTPIQTAHRPPSLPAKTRAGESSWSRPPGEPTSRNPLGNLARARCACLELWIFHEIDNLVNVGDVLEADPVHGNHLEFAHGGGMGVFLVLAEPTSRNPFGIFARAPPAHGGGIFQRTALNLPKSLLSERLR